MCFTGSELDLSLPLPWSLLPAASWIMQPGLELAICSGFTEFTLRIFEVRISSAISFSTTL